MDGSSWNALVMQAAAALKPGGYLIARSMLQEEISSPADRLFSREPRIPGDASPLCPVVWIGRKHESIGA